ncbi:MAG: hypothetical protein ACYSXF_05940 [Planctomycetota bacterium]|jgi:hypothetical protein
MTTEVRTNHPRLFTRRCVVCGYDGALLRGGYAERCARCGCDLRDRPARSYAEMEGLVGHPVRLDRPAARPRHAEQLRQRWLVFAAVAVLGLAAILYLAAAALSI